jgi:hypothetical protein
MLPRANRPRTVPLPAEGRRAGARRGGRLWGIRDGIGSRFRPPPERASRGHPCAQLALELRAHHHRQRLGDAVERGGGVCLDDRDQQLDAGVRPRGEI